MTYRQAQELGAHVRKGEEGSLVVYADKIIRTETDAETGEEAERASPFMKGYTVFNVEQIDGLPEHYYGKPQARAESVQRVAHAEAFFAATGANLVHGGGRACCGAGIGWPHAGGYLAKCVVNRRSTRHQSYQWLFRSPM
jgi:antirestriction protein ArdC